MHSPALALGWELWARNRLGLSIIMAGFLAAALLGQVLPAGSPARTVGEVTQGLLMFIFVYLLSVFVYSANSLEGKKTGFPPRLFALPVRTSLLVAWPMLYGMAAVVLLWIGAWLLILIPCGISDRIEWWPALMFAALMASFQAISWTLVHSALLRLTVAIIILPSIALSIAVYCARYNLQITVAQLALLLCAVIVLAYAAAVAGVARDRRGDGLSWAWAGRMLSRVWPLLPDRRQPFASPGAAQRWLEVRRHAWMLPAFTAMFLVMLFWATALPLGPGEVGQVVVAAFTFPVLLAFFAGFGMGKTSFWTSDYRLSSFLAARPLSSAALARAKLQAAVVSVAVSWTLILVLFPLWVILSGNASSVRQLVETLTRDQETWKLVLAAPALLIGLMGLAWLQAVGGMCLSLTGRPALVNGFALTAVALVSVLVGFSIYSSAHPDFFETFLVILWWLGSCLMLLKLGAVGWIWSRAEWRRLTMPALLMLWLLVAGCLLGTMYSLVPETPVPKHLIVLFVVLALPLTRLMAVPAALAWNRHR
jgi:hypothetical protein